jgi:hypothetical protein
MEYLWTRGRPVLAASFGIIVVSWFFWVGLKFHAVAEPDITIPDHQALYSCLDRTITSLKLSTLDFDQYERIWRLCGNEVYNQLYLVDFSIRREKLVRQELDERVNLWMVVFITVAGVVLAGIQLLTSYKLASVGITGVDNNSELLIQHNKISLKSSLTGILILAISLVFFMIYVLWIYSVREINTQRPSNLDAAPSTVSTRAGGLGYTQGNQQPTEAQGQLHPPAAAIGSAPVATAPQTPGASSSSGASISRQRSPAVTQRPSAATPGQ